MKLSDNRQKIRTWGLILSLGLFPIIFNYLSPYVILDGAFQGIIVGSFLVFLLMMLSSLYFGRFYCGWICPAAKMQEVCASRINNRPIQSKKWIKWLIWFPWLGTIFSGFVLSGSLDCTLTVPIITGYQIERLRWERVFDVGVLSPSDFLFDEFDVPFALSELLIRIR